MKNHLLNYAKYNLWANQKVTDFLRTLSDEQLDKEIASSFSKIRKTILHVWDAQQIWLMRLDGKSLSYFPSKDFSGTFEDAINGLLKSSQDLIDFVESNGENFFEAPVSYTNLAGDAYKNKVRDIIQHVMNHGTYHRGQIITMLHQLGFAKLFSTDYIAFCREEVEIKN